jgi:hypothetical protein
MMGRWYDNYKAAAVSTGSTPEQADAIAGSNTFLKVAIMPAIVLVAFILIYIARKKVYAAHKQQQQVVA